MDIEKDLRVELANGLASSFKCYEEVELRHALFKNVKVRADLIAIPLAPNHGGLAFAFEVKRPTPMWGYGDWCSHIRQAHDYMFARVSDDRLPEIEGLVVAFCFLFPAPQYRPHGPESEHSPYILAEDVTLATGAFHLGLHLRVGRCYWDKKPPHRMLVLAFGPNDVWNSVEGFVPRGRGLLGANRQIGSRSINVLEHLEK
jgi:hypothetical protein